MLLKKTVEPVPPPPSVQMEAARFCVVIPAYCEERFIRPLVQYVRALGLTAVVVDDGSGDRTALEAEAGGGFVLRHPVNRGKGVALKTGLEWAREQGYEAAVTLDADGQHDPAEIPNFLEAYRRTGIPVLIGNRMWEPRGMPAIRYWTNRLMSGMLNAQMKQYVPDTQCGYRLIRCDLVPFVAARSERFAAESEILLRMSERGIRIGSVRITTIYGEEKSSIRPVSDTLQFFRMLLVYRYSRRKRR
ncbi:MAG: glycosyltransferase family 2 protein [Kiritimatiellia bacterium]|nr:glycosyltransferase family 2 protein [Kiritimatiellia bacterium]